MGVGAGVGAGAGAGLTRAVVCVPEAIFSNMVFSKCELAQPLPASFAKLRFAIRLEASRMPPINVCK